jgi:flavin reductase (DIM6/NTAB) family NADH-FMN oxidoreductase RutF/nitroreductase
MGQHEPLNDISSDLFRSLMRNIASSVAVITTNHNSRPHGMTATAVCSVSANPPTILIVINRSTRSHPLIAASKTFVVNVLSEAQSSIGDRFSGKLDNQFDGIEYMDAPSGCPIIKGAAAYIECRTVTEQETGTHTIFIGRVIGGGLTQVSPLLYHDGEYKYVTSRTDTRDVDPIFLDGWSPRSFEQDSIDDKTIASFFEAARWAPDSMNARLWRFVYLLRDEDGWSEFLSALSKSNRSWARRASALVAFISRETMEHEGNQIGSPTHSFDSGAAWMSFALQATLAGWHTHCMAGFDQGALRRILRVPDGYRIDAVAAVGKIGDCSKPTDQLKSREVRSERHPLEALVFKRAYGGQGQLKN